MKDVADVLKITPPRLSDIFKGAREVQSDEILPLANLLGVTPTGLLKSLEKKRPVKLAEATDTPQIPVEGQITGTGMLLPLADNFPFSSVSVPPDASGSEGLRCFVMGDDSLAQEIRPGSLMIAADPRCHYFPFVPGTILLVERDGAKLIPRLYHKAPDGTDWLIPCPPQPNPAFETFLFDTHGNMDTGSQTHARVSIDDIAAAVLWVHRRYN